MKNNDEETFGEEITTRRGWLMPLAALLLGLYFGLRAFDMLQDGASLGYFELLIAIIFAGPGAWTLYQRLNGKPFFFASYTLNSVGLLCRQPWEGAPRETIPWATMRRVELLPEDPSKLRLTMVGVDPKYDAVPPAGAKLIGALFENYKASRAFADSVQERTFVLDAAKTEQNGQRFGDRFGIWFAQRAINAETTPAGTAPLIPDSKRAG